MIKLAKVEGTPVSKLQLRLKLWKLWYITPESHSQQGTLILGNLSLILDLNSQFFQEYSHSHSQLSNICLRNLILNLASQEFSPEFSFSISTLSKVALAEV